MGGNSPTVPERADYCLAIVERGADEVRASGEVPELPELTFGNEIAAGTRGWHLRSHGEAILRLAAAQDALQAAMKAAATDR